MREPTGIQEDDPDYEYMQYVDDQLQDERNELIRQEDHSGDI